MRKKIVAVTIAMALTTGCVYPALASADAAQSTEAAQTTEAVQEVSKDKQDIGLTGVDNARQLGGYVTEDGRKVKENVLLRTAKLVNATDDDIAKLTDTYHLDEICDFRTSSEREAEPDPEIDGVDNVWISIIDEGTMNSMSGKDKETEESETQTQADESSAAGSSSTESASGAAAQTQDPVDQMIAYVENMDVSSMYVDMVKSEHSQEGYHQFFEELLTHGDGAILWHCTAGKDRAGLGAVLLLSALGVDRETALEDFDLTNQYYGDKVDQMAEAAKAKGLSDDKVEQLKGLVGVNRSYMEAALDYIDEQYGDVNGYLKNALKLTDDDIKALQDKYLE